MNDIDIAKLKELAEKARKTTCLPWRKKGPFKIVDPDGYEIANVSSSLTTEYIAAASPDVVLALIEELERLRAREADYRQYLAGIGQGLELREADEKENEKELEKVLDEIERLKKLSALWKHDYEELAASASDARKKNERLEKEADWLARVLSDVCQGIAIQCDTCGIYPGINPKCRRVTKQDWRKAARKAVEVKNGYGIGKA